VSGSQGKSHGRARGRRNAAARPERPSRPCAAGREARRAERCVVGLTRRHLLVRGAAAVLAGPAIVRASARGADGKRPPSERLTLGSIGLGSMGLRHVKGFVQETDCRLAAVCDVDASRRYAAAKVVNTAYGTSDCMAVADFREIIRRPDLDALIIAVPDHWHAALAIRAIRAGKHVYGEKPLAYTIDEGKAIVRAVRRYGSVWQTGSWQRSTRHFRQACELVRNGRIGKVARVEIGIGTGPTIEPQPVMPVPDGFDYDLWLGPAPWAPYTEKRCHWNFRWILDYSGGQVTDWGAHHIDIAQWGMGTDRTGPVAVEGTGVFPGDGLYDAATHYRFTCTYADGRVLEVASNDRLRQGVRFIGEDGWVHVTRAGLTTQPADLVRDEIRAGEIHLARPRGDHRQGHRRDWLDCIRHGGEPITPVEVGHRSITIAHLGNIAMRLGRRVRWDPETQEILDDPGAAGLMGRNMRSPWTV